MAMEMVFQVLELPNTLCECANLVYSLGIFDCWSFQCKYCSHILPKTEELNQLQLLLAPVENKGFPENHKGLKKLLRITILNSFQKLR